jgi:ABC-type nitrate/sulfonate/bicarbonate transport system substrate-binding protein/formylglycine-generating enzyme required for sulfatase activity
LRAAEKLTPVVMQLDWKPNVQFAGLLLAKEKGYYAAAGLDVTIKPVDVEMKVVEAVATGSNWIGCSESGVLINARAQGQPIKAFATMFQGSPFCLMSLKSKGITEPKHLIGKTLGVHPDANKALDIVLNHAGVDRAKMTCIDVEHSIQPLIKGQVDVLMGYLIDEAVALETSGHPVNVIPGYEHGYVAYSQVYFTSEELLKRDPKLLQKFLEASNRGWRDAFADIKGTAKFVVEKYLPGANLAYQTKSLEKIAAISGRETGTEKLGTMNRERWVEMCALFEKFKIVPRAVTAEEMTDFSILNAVYPPKRASFENSLGMRFATLPGTRTLMSIWETRVADFKAFVDATSHDATGGMMTLGADDYDWLPKGHTWRDPGFPQSDAHPVVGVNWFDARAFCSWLTERERGTKLIAATQQYRLPTDSEWSLAIGLETETGATPEERMMNGTERYPWGVSWPPPAGFGNFAGTESAAGKPSWWGTMPGGPDDAFPRTAPVGSFPANALGLYDLSGNVWEWCEDAFTTSSLAKITRGGCWGSDRPAYLLSARRSFAFPKSRNDETGFRIVLAEVTP